MGLGPSSKENFNSFRTCFGSYIKTTHTRKHWATEWLNSFTHWQKHCEEIYYSGRKKLISLYQLFYWWIFIVFKTSCLSLYTDYMLLWKQRGDQTTEYFAQSATDPRMFYFVNILNIYKAKDCVRVYAYFMLEFRW